MINYEIGGKLIQAGGDIWTITQVLTEYLEIERETKKILIKKNPMGSMNVSGFGLGIIIAYAPPTKECKTCGRGYEIDREKESARLAKIVHLAQMGYSYNVADYINCPECTKPKQEEKKPQPKFKVGDKVRILSDVKWYDEMIKEGVLKSAVGKVGTIKHILDDPITYDVFDLPIECQFISKQFLSEPFGLFYSEDQLEKLIPITEEVYYNLKAGDKLICVETWAADYIKDKEYKVLEGKPTRVVIEWRKNEWFKPDFKPLSKYFMLVEPKEKDALKKFQEVMQESDKLVSEFWETKKEDPADEHRKSNLAYGAAMQKILDEPFLKEGATKVQEALDELNPHWSKDDKPKFTKGQKIRHKEHGDILTFKEYFEKMQLLFNKQGIFLTEELPENAFYEIDFEPVEYVSFSKALEWLKEGYRVARLEWGSFLSMKFQLDNSFMTVCYWYVSDGPMRDSLCSNDILANDWYWVEKPEAK